MRLLLFGDCLLTRNDPGDLIRYMSDYELFGAWALAALLFAQLIRWGIIESRLRNPCDKSVVYLDEVPQISSLNGPGPFLIRVFRQSGNLQQDDRITDDSAQAIKAAIATLKRAGIDYVCVTKNNEAVLRLKRPYHSHRGRAEGKKVGSVDVYDIGREGPRSFFGGAWCLNAVLIVTAIGLLGFLAFVWARNSGLFK